MNTPSTIPPTPHASERKTHWKVLADLGGSYTVQMPVADWITLPDHPRQRDTLRQSRKSHWQAAKEAQGPVLESLRWVIAAELDGEVFKVDGHTRGLLWEKGKLRNPQFVFATVFRCKSREELNTLYGAFDTQLAAETMFDRVTGAYREHGLHLTSKRLRAGTIVDALSVALRGVARSNEKGPAGEDDIDIYGAVGFFAPELKLLDTVDPQPEVFYTGVVAAALLALALDPTSVEFFERVSKRLGSKKEGLLDPVEAILSAVGNLKRQRAAWVKAQQEDLCARTLRAVFTWQAGPDCPDYWIRGEPAPVALLEVIRAVKARKEQGAV